MLGGFFLDSTTVSAGFNICVGVDKAFGFDGEIALAFGLIIQPQLMNQQHMPIPETPLRFLLQFCCHLHHSSMVLGTYLLHKQRD